MWNNDREISIMELLLRVVCHKQIHDGHYIHMDLLYAVLE